MIEGSLWRARHLFRRVHSVERVMVEQVQVIETMTPQDFLEFRSVLAPASGFQSVQFRELEFISGVKDPAYLTRLRDVGDAETARLKRRLAEPSLWDAYLTALSQRGLPISDDEIMDSLLAVARDRDRTMICGSSPRISSPTTRPPLCGGCGTSRWSNARSAPNPAPVGRPARRT